MPPIPELDLSISSLSAAYRNGSMTPGQVLEVIDRKVRQTESCNIWIQLLSPEQRRPYLNKLLNKNPDSLPLYGIPFAVKDNIDLAGVPTTAACPAYAYVPDRSAFVVEQLVAAGAIPIGKTNLDQFATGLVGTRSPYGVVRNSLNPDFIAGGSSSGSAVAVALGLVSFALGTDTAGSGRIPAAFNQLCGFKPSKGLISTRGIVPACRTQDCVSVFVNERRDLVPVLKTLLVADALEPSLHQYGLERDAIQARLSAPNNKTNGYTVGIPQACQLHFFGYGNYSRRFLRTVEAIRATGWQCREIDLTPCLSAAQLLYAGPWVTERYLVAENLLRNSPQALLPEIRQILEPGGRFSAADTFQALYRLQELKALADAQLAQVDCILTPTAGGIFTIDDVARDPIQRNSELGYYTNFMNLLDYAAIAVPGDLPEDGLAFGVTLFDFRGQDAALLEVALAFEEVTRVDLQAIPLDQCVSNYQ